MARIDENLPKKPRQPARPGGGKPKNRDKRRAQRRQDAEARQLKYDAMSLEEKIARAHKGSREWVRLRQKVS